ncbi:MAG TPA: flagellar biosynthetic protein FliR [Acidobacteriaceae bacterium]|jgi:flagellar biosynthetic protein FliR|nr:flagellar biosynthetic protein FliR [Acidobacteriaceae bacterium]
MIRIPIFTIIAATLTIGVRLSGLMLFAPFFGSVVIPPRIKAVLVLALTALLYPVVSRDFAAPSLDHWPFLVFTEFLIGAGLGIATNLVFEAVQMTGQILGVQMGYSLVNILDPQSQVDTTVVAVFYQSIVMLLFLRMDVHFWLLRAVGNSYSYLPPGTAHLNGLFTLGVLHVVGDLFGVGIQIAAPVMSATLAADVVLGLLGKASPQMPLMLLGPAVKSLIGLTVLIATLRYWPDLFRRLFMDAMLNGDRLLHLAR